MVQYLATGGLEVKSDTKTLERQQHLDETVEMLMSIPADAPRGCWPEVTLEYPDELHDAFLDFPPAPEKRVLTYAMLSPKQRELVLRYSGLSPLPRSHIPHSCTGHTACSARRRSGWLLSCQL